MTECNAVVTSRLRFLQCRRHVSKSRKLLGGGGNSLKLEMRPLDGERKISTDRAAFDL